MDADKYAIRINNLSVQFGSFTALDRVSSDIKQEKITGLIGPSGAGKTTLIRSIVGRQLVDQGSITVLNKPAGCKELRSILSYKTQEISAYYDLTVTQNIEYFAIMMNVAKKHVKEETNRLIELMDLQKQKDQLVGSLSGGQKQRVSLAISLIGNPQVLVLDEPTVGLDPVLRDELWNLFRSLAQNGCTIIVSSHAMDEAERCDDLMLMRDGKVISHQTPTEMLHATKSRTIEESFLKLVKDRL